MNYEDRCQHLEKSLSNAALNIKEQCLLEMLQICTSTEIYEHVYLSTKNRTIQDYALLKLEFYKANKGEIK